MEILAEAAVTLLPEKTLVGMRDIQAYRWIQVDEDPVSIQIEAKLISQSEVRVKIIKHNEKSVNGKNASTEIINGTIVFANSYPAVPPTDEFVLKGERRSRLASVNLYDGKLMFHGPSFQGVSSVDRTGEDGLKGKLEILSTAGMVRTMPVPDFVTDPVVLDAAGQLVGYWTAENLEQGFVVFPYRLKELQLFQTNHQTGELLDCRLRLQLLGNERIRSDIDILGANGALWMRLTGWEDMRFDVPDRFHKFWTSPETQFLGTAWDVLISQLPETESTEGCIVESFFDKGNRFWQDLWASLILSRNERKVYHGSGMSDKRLRDWLLGRAASKDAVRMYLKKHHKLDVFPADIEIGKDDHGSPFVKGNWLKSIPEAPVISLSHSKDKAVAVVSSPTNGNCLGVDLQAVRETSASFINQSFTVEEQSTLASFPDSMRGEWVMRCWCAKEAVAKALGRGLIDGPQGVRIKAIDKELGVMKVRIHGELARLFPDIEKIDLAVYTVFESNYAAAMTQFKGTR